MTENPDPNQPTSEETPPLSVAILAGGSGVRFWPLSRKALPKQFLNFFGDKSLLADTAARLDGLVPPSRLWVLTNHRHVERTRNQLPQVPPEQIVGEPVARDTAGCLAVAAALLVAQSPEARMLVLPADHLIRPIAAFQQAVQACQAVVAAHPEMLLTLGIPPTHPATGYGYLERGEDLGTFEGVPAYRLSRFCEKPDTAQAREFLESGRFRWNAGIFFWRAASLLEQFETHEPAMAAAARRVADAWGTPQASAVFEAEFSAMRKVSIDYAIMEKAPRVAMVEAPFNWDDVGSWLALERHLSKTPEGNVVVGKHVGQATTNSVVVADSGKLVGTLGVENLIVVASGDAVLVAHRDREQEVKGLLDAMGQQNLDEYL